MCVCERENATMRLIETDELIFSPREMPYEALIEASLFSIRYVHAKAFCLGILMYREVGYLLD